MMPPVAEFLASSLLEWEDRLSAVVIVQGCNFRCPFCHSAKMVPAGKPEREVPWEAVEAELASRGGWLDGVVVSGGEPTIHAGLDEMLERLRELELPVKLDTNGSAPEALRGLVERGLVRHVALDVKALLSNPDDYARATAREGALEKVRETLEFLKSLDNDASDAVSCEIRTTVVPGLLDDERGSDEPLLELARELAWADRWYLQAFRPVGCLDPECDKLPETDPNWLAAVAEKCRELAPGCRVRGG